MTATRAFFHVNERVGLDTTYRHPGRCSIMKLLSMVRKCRGHPDLLKKTPSQEMSINLSKAFVRSVNANYSLQCGSGCFLYSCRAINILSAALCPYWKPHSRVWNNSINYVWLKPTKHYASQDLLAVESKEMPAVIVDLMSQLSFLLKRSNKK